MAGCQWAPNGGSGDLLQLFADGAEQYLIGQGFFQNSLDAERGRELFDHRIGRGCDHDRRHLAAAFAQFGHELETVQTGIW
jgi:hypothetical protein